MKRNIIILAFAALLCVGCDNDSKHSFMDEGVMYIEALHPSFSRVTETDFEISDEIGVYATEYSNEKAVPLQISGNWANNVSAVYDGTLWNTAKKIFLE